jgi:transposase
VRALNRVECVGETLRHALAVVAPDWLRTQAPAAWYERDGVRIGTIRRPLTTSGLAALAATICGDGAKLLTAIYAPEAATGTLRLRGAPDVPPAERLIHSPTDCDVRFATKREVSWAGYRLHLTETCEADLPRLISQVPTVPATTNDVEMSALIRTDLAALDLLPGAHLLDAGYVSARHLVTSATSYGIDLAGPALPGASWPATSQVGFDLTCFSIDWERRTVTCSQGKTSRSWQELSRGVYPFTQVQFSKADCRACPVRARCTRAVTERRQLSLRPREEHLALQAARARQTSEPGSRARWRKAHGAWGHAGHATARWRRCDSNMWPSPRPSACSNSTPGGPRRHQQPRAPHASRP